MRNLTSSEMHFIQGAGINKDNRERAIALMLFNTGLGLSLLTSRDLFYKSLGKILLAVNLSLYVHNRDELWAEVENVDLVSNTTQPVS